MSQVHERKVSQGPGPKGSPKQKLIRKWWLGNFTYGELECGHEVRLTKQYEHQPGIKVPCGECPR
jgi:hypothetical protein